MQLNFGKIGNYINVCVQILIRSIEQIGFITNFPNHVFGKTYENFKYIEEMKEVILRNSTCFARGSRRTVSRMR